jgi:hypothetical protein
MKIAGRGHIIHVFAVNELDHVRTPDLFERAVQVFARFSDFIAREATPFGVRVASLFLAGVPTIGSPGASAAHMARRLKPTDEKRCVPWRTVSELAGDTTISQAIRSKIG